MKVYFIVVMRTEIVLILKSLKTRLKSKMSEISIGKSRSFRTLMFDFQFTDLSVRRL